MKNISPNLFAYDLKFIFLRAFSLGDNNFITLWCSVDLENAKRILANTKQTIPKYNPTNSIWLALLTRDEKKGSRNEDVSGRADAAQDTKSFIIKKKYPNKSNKSLNELATPVNILLIFALYNITPKADYEIIFLI